MTDNKTNYSIKTMPKNATMESCLDKCFSKYNDTSRVINGSSDIAGIPVKTMIYKDKNNKTIHEYYFYQKNDTIYQLFSKGKYNKKAVESLINSTRKQTFF